MAVEANGMSEPWPPPKSVLTFNRLKLSDTSCRNLISNNIAKDNHELLVYVDDKR